MWYTYIPDHKKGRVLKKKTDKKSIEKEIIKYWKNESDNPSIKEIFYAWMERKLEYKDICIGSFNRYEKDFKRYFEDDSGFADRRVRSIETSDITPFLRGAIAKYSLTSKAYSNLRTITNGIFKYAKEKGYIAWSISQTIGDMELPRRAFHKVIKEDDEEVFNDEEMKKVLEYLASVPDLLNLGIMLMFCTGIRVGELVALKWCDFDGNAIKIRRSEISYKDSAGKNVCEIRDYPKSEAGIRTVFVPAEFSSIIGRLKLLSENKEYVFLKDKHNITTSQIRKRLYSVCKITGVRKK